MCELSRRDQNENVDSLVTECNVAVKRAQRNVAVMATSETREFLLYDKAFRAAIANMFDGRRSAEACQTRRGKQHRPSEIALIKQGHHHNGDQAARRPHVMCSICGRRFAAP